MQKILEECLSITRTISDIDEKIEKLKTAVTSPKNQIITDMPKSGSIQSNPMESYMIKLERLEKRKAALCEKRNDRWNTVKIELVKSNMACRDILTMLWLRFYRGLSWESCAAKMKEMFAADKWNINKCFRVYRKVLGKTHNKNA